MAISVADMLVDVSLYLMGATLDPDVITNIMGMAPSSSRRKGDPKIKATPSAVHSTGLWMLSRSLRSDGVDEEVGIFLRSLDAERIARASAFADRAFIDVFIARTVAGKDLESSVEFELSASTVKGLYALGLPVKFSVSNVAGSASNHS